MDVLAFGPHPDDVEIGMGGTIAKHNDLGDNVLILTFTGLLNGHTNRESELRNAARLLGAEIDFVNIDMYDIRHSRDNVEVYDSIIKKHDPNIIYTPWRGDSHQDHKFMTDCVISATRRNRCSVCMYETTLPGGITTHSFKPQLYNNISSYADLKIAALRQHQSQYNKFGENWIEGIVGRMNFRGSQINVSAAEAFEIIKLIRD
jgi:LmbE family N-acetylglucosaminyl deacetylase